MIRSADRFLTTHTGSLPRPDDLIRMMYAKEEGVPVEPAALAARVRDAVAEVVKKQLDAGIDIVNDGEMSKPSYATYVKDRLAGFGGAGNTFVYQDLAEFPNLAKRVFGDPGRSRRKTPACNAPIQVRDADAAKADVDNLKTALAALASEASGQRGNSMVRAPDTRPEPGSSARVAGRVAADRAVLHHQCLAGDGPGIPAAGASAVAHAARHLRGDRWHGSLGRRRASHR
jgi:hypothetical protein